MRSALFVFMVLIICEYADAQSLTGTYTGITEDGDAVILKIEEHSDKTVSGTATINKNVAKLSGRINGSGATGTETIAGYSKPLRFELRRRGEQQIVLTSTIDGEEMPPVIFTRVGATSSAASPGRPTATRPPAAQAAMGKPDGVRVNGVAVQAGLLRTYEQRYNLRILPGDYWYDRIAGAWGVIGGPALGITLPGLEWGGKLRADASNGDTGVFVNGRQLHRLDIALLQQITIVIPGRYWLSFNGDYGFEGGPRMGNFVDLIRSATTPTRREGILSTYDKTGVSVIGGEALIHY